MKKRKKKNEWGRTARASHMSYKEGDEESPTDSLCPAKQLKAPPHPAKSEGKHKTYPPTKDTYFNHVLKTLPQDHTTSQIQHHNSPPQYQRTAKSYFISVA